MHFINGLSPNKQLFSMAIDPQGIISCLEDQDGKLEVPGASRLELAVEAKGLTSTADATGAATAGLVYDLNGEYLLPAAIDIHVHSRDPGLTQKETWQTLAKAAYKGGVTTVADMPNTIPPTMDAGSVREKAALAAASGLQAKFFLGVGAANIDQVAGLLSDPQLPLCGLKVYYGQSTGELMYDDLETLGRHLPRDNPKMIVFHSEDQCMVDRNELKYQQALDTRENEQFKTHSDIRSSAAAHKSTKVILQWAENYERPIHIAHVSTPLEVELIAAAKAKGVQVTSEVSPHHLLLSTDDYERLGPYGKMNPPLRHPDEVKALLELFGQGAIEIFATDHAPHTKAEKERPLRDCPSGVPGIEHFYPLLFAASTASGLPLESAVAMATRNPATLFSLQARGELKVGYPADCTVLEQGEWTINSEEVVSKCGWTPYDRMQVPVRTVATWQTGIRVY